MDSHRHNKQSQSHNTTKGQIRKGHIEPSLEEVIKFLQQRPDMIISERNPYQADRLMMMLDNEKLAALEEEFNEHPNGIELPNFIWLMKCAISHPPDEKYDLVNGLIKLFQDIDINGDGSMEWAEFTQYIIDAVIGEKDSRFFDARFEMAREMTEIEVLDRAYSRKGKRYVPMSVFDKSTHSNLIKKVLYTNNSDSVICLEQNSNKLKFYNSECQEKEFKIKPSSEDQSIFVIDFHICDELNVIAAVTSDRQFFFWENNLTSRLVKNFKQDILQTGIWYMPLHKLWITAGADYNIHIWEISFVDKDSIGKELYCLHAHMKQITELVELTSPKMIASCSLDGKIKLWDLSDRSFATELKSPNSNQRGIRGMAYSYEYGSNLLTYGFEMHLNVWCPEVSLTRAFIGKLEGHSSLIIMCKFIPQTPNCITVDDRTNIRIWDIRTMATVQVIASESTSVVTGLCVIPRGDKFIITGKRLNYYKNGAVATNSKREQRGMIDDIYPINVDFNLYYNSFVVLTKMDIRIYDAMSGKMKKVFNELYDDKMSLDLSNFAFGGRQRKFFLSDNGGMIRQYNIKNGEFLKKVNKHNEIENSEFANKLDNTKKRDALYISAILFLQEEKLLISASQDSTIRIYDETDPEESILLKVLCGGHQNTEILSMSYSQHFTLLATGSSNGLISIWDFETGKIDCLLIGQQSEVISIDFADPYPILVSGQSNGVISVWTIKPSSGIPKARCILRILNSIFTNKTQQAITLTSISVFSERSKGIVRYASLPEYKPDASEKISFIIQEQNKKKNTNMINIEEEIDNFQKDWDKYEQDLMLNKRRCFVYVADARGVMHILNLTEFLNRREIYEFEKVKKGHSYQLKRKDLFDASKAVEGFLLQEERSALNPPLTVHSFGSVLIKQWIAHSAPITRINKIKEPPSFVSNSLDKHFKIWAINGSLYADVNLSKFDETVWKFPFDWVGQKMKDIELVFDALKLIEKEDLSEHEKNRIVVRFLLNKFFNESQTEELQRILQDQQNLLSGQQQIEIIQTKEKKKVPTNQNEKQNALNFANKQVHEELKDIKQRMKEQIEGRKKIEVDTGMEKKLILIKQDVGILERPKTQQGDFIQRLAGRLQFLSPDHAQVGTAPVGVDRARMPLSQPSKDIKERVQDQNIEDSSKQKTNKKKLAHVTSAANHPKRQIDPQSDQFPILGSTKSQYQLPKEHKHQLKISSISVMKNNLYANNMVNSLPRPNSENMQHKQMTDMKYQKGEGTRAMKIATYSNTLKFMAGSQLTRCDDNEILQSKVRVYKELYAHQKSELQSSEEDEDEKTEKPKPKIIASHNFLNNTSKNKHKVLKTKSKVFVV